jgi:recombinational DNA repair protein RecR
MMTNEALRAKHAEALEKIKQSEADLYYLQGYLQAIDEIINDAISMDELAQAVGAKEIEVIENES